MPIYEYYSPKTNKIYSFYAKTLAQGKTIPKCPDDPAYKMVKVMSTFAIATGGPKTEESPATPDSPDAGDPPVDDGRMDAAMGQLEKEMGSIDENDPKAMGRLMRRMSELTGEKLDGEAEEVVRKLEEGTDPEELEAQLGEMGGPEDEMGGGGGFPGGRSPMRDPTLYDY